MRPFQFILVSALASVCVSHASANPLIGSGNHLPLPVAPGVIDERLLATYAPGGSPDDFTGSWPSTVLAPWQGTFVAQGPNPAVPQGSIGATWFDFTGLNAGFLPAGTAINLGDL